MKPPQSMPARWDLCIRSAVPSFQGTRNGKPITGWCRSIDAVRDSVRRRDARTAALEEGSREDG